MNFSEFENIVSHERLQRYLIACNGNKQKALTLYRYNLQLSEALYSVINCFEVALRNAINKKLCANLGPEWLRDSVMDNGIFDIPILHKTQGIIKDKYLKLRQCTNYTHSKLLAEMNFGIWKYMFSPIQYRQTGRNLLTIFPNKPKSNRTNQYNQSYIFNEIDKISSLRNRIAHHEPVCFERGSDVYNTSYALMMYNKMLTLFQWMDIDSHKYLYGIDHVKRICAKIEGLREK
jgi:hypothetical protein